MEITFMLEVHYLHLPLMAHTVLQHLFSMMIMNMDQAREESIAITLTTLAYQKMAIGIIIFLIVLLSMEIMLK